MKYGEFREKVCHFSYFKPSTISQFVGNSRTLKNQLVTWQRQGKVILLKRGFYTLNEQERLAPLPHFLVSNLLCAPSYVSFEAALSDWGLIPERVVQVTAVTPRRTAVFKNRLGVFRYRFIKRERFFGYDQVEREGLPVLMAFPEKALLDQIYFDRSFRPEADYFLANLRLQNFERLSVTRLLAYGRRFRSRKVMAGARILKDLIAAERR